jgi:uncharacterized repeat protein (TIGR01451 family)
MLHIANSTTDTTGSGPGQGGGIGNIGVGGSGAVQVNGGGAAVNGNVDFTASNTGQFSGISPSGTVNFNVSVVTNALNTVNALNTTLGALPGAPVAINGNTTINASNGILSASGMGYTNVRVFTVTSFSLMHGQTLTINGDVNGDTVVLNFTSNTDFFGNVVLTGGLTPNNVIFNFVGGSNLMGGPALHFNTGSGGLAQGIFLNPNGTISSQNSNILGRIFGGDSDDLELTGHSNITAPSLVTPTLTTTPEQTNVTLGPNSVTLTDTATLSGGNNPSGNLVFTLSGPGGFSESQTVTVNGNGGYMASITLPTSGMVAGTYQWTAVYSGDNQNHEVSDSNPDDELVTVRPATPTLVTNASPAIVPPPTPASIDLTDTATLSGGYFPTGNLIFTLIGPEGNDLFTTTKMVTGNGDYTASTTLQSPVTGAYTWVVTYEGDDNNVATKAQGFTTEQTVIPPPTLSLVTAVPNTTIQLGPSEQTLSDDATLFNALAPGTITFTLTGPDDFSDSDVVNVSSGTNTYTGSITLPTTGVVAGSYMWSAVYESTDHTSSAHDQGGIAELVMVEKASPTIVTTAPPDVTLPAGPPGTVELSDSAELSGGYFPTGNLVFTLSGPGGFSESQTDTVNGNGTYTARITLPETGMVAGTYTWTVTYAGDDNNNSFTEEGNATNEEQTVVSPASPTVVTTASPTTAAPGTTLQDSAVLTGGYFPTGDLVFSLYAPGLDPTVDLPTYTETVPVNGNGTYHTNVGFVANATGTWHWVVTYDGDPNNNTVDSGPLDEPVTIQPPPPETADVSVTKQANQSNPVFGTPVTYTLFAHNNGPNTATDVVATDVLPAGIVFVSATATQGSFDPGSGHWSVGTLANGASATLQITGLVAAIGPITNTSTVTADEFDPNLSNNTSTATIDGMFAAGQISKRLFLSSNDTPLNPAMLAAEEALFNALMPIAVNMWDTLLSVARSLLAAHNNPGPGNGGVPIFQGNWFGSPLVVYANPFVGQVTAVQVGAFDFLYENNTVAGVRLF